jgi:choice-of-anchor C domain-containing protein
MRNVLVLVAFLSVAMVSGAHASPILVNGSFEDGPAMNGPLCSIAPHTCQDVDVAAGSSAIPGWEVFAAVGGVDYNGPPWDVSDGVHAIDLDGRSALFAGVRQTFTTVAGRPYRLAFDLSGNPGGGPAIKQVRVSVDGVDEEVTHDSSGESIDDLTWETYAFWFIATGSSATVSFTSLTGIPNSFGALIDNVSVTVPEPPVTALAALTLAAFGLRRRRLRASQRPLF